MHITVNQQYLFNCVLINERDRTLRFSQTDVLFSTSIETLLSSICPINMHVGIYHSLLFKMTVSCKLLYIL